MKVKREYVWQCGYCGKDFTTTHYGQRYCTPAHKQRAYEIRKASKDATDTAQALGA